MNNYNEYDKYAADRQRRLQTGQEKPHVFVEKPMMKKLLQDIRGQKVLLLGCGTGEETKLLAKAGAKEIVGIDISHESIKLAKETYPNYHFQVGDMHDLEFRSANFDFVYASLAIHYSAKPKKIFKEVHRVLKPGGKFQFSVTHPLRYSSKVVKIDGTPMRVMGYSTSKSNPKTIGNYHSYTKNVHSIPTGEKLELWAGPPSLYWTWLKESKFNVLDFVESKTVEECQEVDGWYYKCYHEFPQFMGWLVEKIDSKKSDSYFV